MATLKSLLFFRQTRRLRRVRSSLQSSWGQPQPRERDFTVLGEFNQACPNLWDKAPASIDDQTWSDLNMNEVFAAIDRTFSTAGECLLYRILRCPVNSPDGLLDWKRLIRLFQDEPETRLNIQAELVSAGRANARGLIALVWARTPPPSEFRWLFNAMAMVALIALFAGALAGKLGFAIVIPVFIVNMLIHQRQRTQLMGRLGALRQAGALVSTASAISKIDSPEMASHTAEIRQALMTTKPIARRVAWLLPEGSASGDIAATALEYVSIFFLHEVRTFQAVLSHLITARKDLQKLFQLVGELDACQSIASFRAGSNQYCEPQFDESGPPLAIRDGRHPLLPDPVPNSIELQGTGVAVTGSNMSGKTTFLKMIGVNALLAQTIHTCLATEYRSRMLQIMASMNETDNLVEGKSYYLAEAERLLKMVHASEDSRLVLCLIDEPLAGTNSPERLAASREILRYLVQHHGLVMVSSHDVELVTQLQQQGLFEACYFADQAGDDGIRFDYQLRRGLDYHGNAIKVLKYLGYPDVIVSGALGGLAPSTITPS
jgi:hypothetical protein